MGGDRGWDGAGGGCFFATAKGGGERSAVVARGEGMGGGMRKLRRTWRRGRWPVTGGSGGGGGCGRESRLAAGVRR